MDDAFQENVQCHSLSVGHRTRCHEASRKNKCSHILSVMGKSDEHLAAENTAYCLSKNTICKGFKQTER